MKVLKKTGFFLLRFIEGFAAFLFFYLTVTLYGGSISTGSLKSNGDIAMYVQSNGIHTDICIPTKSKLVDWGSFIPQNEFDSSVNCDFITIGWGDKGFFLDTPTWAELKVSTALNAAFLPSPTAMHVKYSSEPSVSDSRKKVFVDWEEYKRLIKFIKESFRTKNKKVEIIKNRGYSIDDNFYEANNHYHLFRTCNIWTNEALKTAGVKTGIYALFPDGILSHLK